MPIWTISMLADKIWQVGSRMDCNSRGVIE